MPTNISKFFPLSFRCQLLQEVMIGNLLPMNPQMSKKEVMAILMGNFSPFATSYEIEIINKIFK